MPAKYVLTQKGKSFHWSLLATNGRVIATSEVYNTKAAAMAGIRSVQKNGPTEVVVTADELAESRAATKRPAKKAGAASSGAAKKTAGAAKKAAGTATKSAGAAAKATSGAAKKTAGAAKKTAGAAKKTTGAAKKTAAKRTPAKKSS